MAWSGRTKLDFMIMIKNSKPRKASASARNHTVAQGDRWLDAYKPYLIYRVAAKLSARTSAQLKPLHMNITRWRVISVLKSHGSLSINGIAKATHVEQPTMSRVVAQLEREGLVARSRIPGLDSRISKIHLTTQGVDIFNRVLPSALMHERIAFLDIGNKEIASFLATLAKIEKNIGNSV
jgi:DNA-binding MarR family transcriptional regulator